MSTLSDVLAEHSVLSGSAVAHLQTVVSEWQLLADLSFSDLLLWVPTRDDLAGLRRPGPADNRGDGVRRRPGLRDQEVLRLPAAPARLGGGAGDVRGAADRRPGQLDPPAGHPGALPRRGHRGDRTGHQQHGRPGEQPAGNRVCGRRGRPVPDGVRRHVPADGEPGRDAHRPAGRRWAAPARRRRQGRVRQPQRAVGLPPAGLQRRGARAEARRADPAVDRRSVRRRRTGGADRGCGAGPRQPADGGRGEGRDRAVPGPAAAPARPAVRVRWCWSGT